ncbi:cytochrome c biogenesis protein CcsA [Alicyclobacillus tolerans]|uniref:cytochrome c biogenesis protein CcsA n=1 Tax=Alicyclobacillus tolerans TaxID=90970 RepID=UPI001F004C59|nr:cytochrome c biogenesis protein CcsA [Alicyclobacillus tolerans]MCF8563401.1 cytochrome c biogenesis protein CcsA [Alicyclobacillus tolerans]
MKRSALWLAVGLGVVAMVNIYLALIWSPPEAQMGNLIRIMYFHVASAWIAFLAFFISFVFAILYLLRRKLVFDRITVSSAEIGLVYTTLTLITGSLWAKPIWNTWWTWDPRLTTTLILWFLYVGYLLLRGTLDGIERRARISSVYAIIAFVDVPIIHFAVEWWRSIHPQVIDDTGVNMPGSMFFTLMFGFFTFLWLYLILLYTRTRQESMRMRLYQSRERLRALRARREGEG